MTETLIGRSVAEDSLADGLDSMATPVECPIIEGIEEYKSTFCKRSIKSDSMLQRKLNVSNKTLIYPLIA